MAQLGLFLSGDTFHGMDYSSNGVLWILVEWKKKILPVERKTIYQISVSHEQKINTKQLKIWFMFFDKWFFLSFDEMCSKPHFSASIYMKTPNLDNGRWHYLPLVLLCEARKGRVRTQPLRLESKCSIQDDMACGIWNSSFSFEARRSLDGPTLLSEHNSFVLISLVQYDLE